MREKKFLKKIQEQKWFAAILLFILCTTLFALPASARESVTLHDFLGYYLCGVADPGEYGNPETFALYFNDEGTLERRSGMRYATVWSATRYEYTDVSLKGNTLVCRYEMGYGTSEIRDGGRPGEHTYVLNEDGTIEADGETWYRYEEETPAPESGVLRTVTDVDFADGNFSDQASFLGVEELKRCEIESILFLDSLEEKPEQSWDVSAAQDGSVQLWFEKSGKKKQVFIAAEGGVKLNPDSKNLFRCCTSLLQPAWWSILDVSRVTDFSYMFCDCKSMFDLGGIPFWKTSAAVTMKAMFRGCSSLRGVPQNYFVMDNVTDMSEMFRDCSSMDHVRIEDWKYSGALNADDAFTGTSWEGTSPLLESSSSELSLGYILNTEILQDRPKLRARLLMAYDGLLEKFWDRNVFYCLKDLNGDEIPEMIVRKDPDEGSSIYKFSVYCFNLVSCRAQLAGDQIFATWPVAYWYPQEQVLNCEGSGDSQFGLVMEKSRLYAIWDYERPETEREALDFTCLWRKPIEIYYFDVPVTETESGTDEADTENEEQAETSDILIEQETETDSEPETVEKEILICATQKSEGSYNYLAIYADDYKVYRRALDGSSSEITTNSFWMDGEDGRVYYIYLHIGSSYTDEYTAILRYEDDTFTEVFSLEDFMDESQLFGENYFSGEVEDKRHLKLTFFLNTYGLGKGTQFSALFSNRGGTRLQQETFVADIEDTWSKSGNVTASETFNAYTTVRADEMAFTVNKGDAVRYDKLWFSNGILWIRIKNNDGENGWIPAGSRALFTETARQMYHTSGGSWFEDLIFGKRYFDLEIPDNGVLMSLGNQYEEEEDYDTAKIYYELIEEKSDYYQEARARLEEIAAIENEEATEDDAQESEKTESSEKLSVYTNYLEENWLDRDVTCAAVDVDNDGAEELLIHYNNTDANCEIYKADPASGEIRYIGQIAYVHYDLYWSEKYEELVQFSRSAGSETYSFYRFENGALEFEFGVSWMEVNNVDKRITGYSYFSDDDRHELGRYEVAANEEEDPQAKAEASKEYRAYLEDMVLIEFSPVLDFIWKKEGIVRDESAAPAEDSMEENGENAEVQQEGDSTVSEENQADEKNVQDETADSEYIISDSNSRYLSSDEVDSFDSEKVRMAINELYARHGRVFTTPEIAAYFQSKSWYQPDESKTDAQIVAEFNEYEKANAELLLTCQS